MFILDSLLVGGLRFVLDKIAAAADAEADDDVTLRERLLEAEMQFELGEISADEFAAIERELLARIRQMQRSRSGAVTMAAGDKITRVRVESYEEEDR